MLLDQPKHIHEEMSEKARRKKTQNPPHAVFRLPDGMPTYPARLLQGPRRSKTTTGSLKLQSPVQSEGGALKGKRAEVAFLALSPLQGSQGPGARSCSCRAGRSLVGAGQPSELRCATG